MNVKPNVFERRNSEERRSENDLQAKLTINHQSTVIRCELPKKDDCLHNEASVRPNRGLDGRNKQRVTRKGKEKRPPDLIRRWKMPRFSIRRCGTQKKRRRTNECKENGRIFGPKTRCHCSFWLVQSTKKRRRGGRRKRREETNHVRALFQMTRWRGFEFEFEISKLSWISKRGSWWCWRSVCSHSKSKAGPSTCRVSNTGKRFDLAISIRRRFFFGMISLWISTWSQQTLFSTGLTCNDLWDSKTTRMIIGCWTTNGNEGEKQSGRRGKLRCTICETERIAITTH